MHEFGTLVVYLCALFLFIIAVCFVAILFLVIKIKQKSDRTNETIKEIIKRIDEKV